MRKLIVKRWGHEDSARFSMVSRPARTSSNRAAILPSGHARVSRKFAARVRGMAVDCDTAILLLGRFDAIEAAPQAAADY
ncbi:hypothetical protein D3C78_1356260 [compost metagenome]